MGHRLRVDVWGVVRKKRSWILFPGLSPDNSFGVFNNTIDVLLKAMLERYYNCEVGDGVFEPPIVPAPGAYAQLNQFAQLLLERMPRCRVLPCCEVVDCYTGPKRAVYQRAMDSLEGEAVSRRDARLSSFSKFEKCDLRKAPRCINPRNPRYNLELARYLKKFEKILYQKIAKVWGDGPTILKGYNSAEQARILHGKWKSFSDPVAVGLDAKKFDMHVSDVALSWEHSVYDGVFNSRKLRRLLRMQIQNNGVAYCEEGRIRFRIRGTRSSGDMNTASGNCLIMCGALWTWRHTNGLNFKLVNNGDDCVAIMERDELCSFQDGLIEYFVALGFRMKVEPAVDIFEQIEFCQTNPVFNGHEYLMVRNPRTCFIKDPMCIHPMQTHRVMQSWCTSVGDCGAVLNQGIPVLQEFYNVFLRLGDGVRNPKMTANIFRGEGRLYLKAGMTKYTSEITSDARLSFYLAFGIDPDHQVMLERYFSMYKCDITKRMDPIHSGGDVVSKSLPMLHYDYEPVLWV